VLLLAGPSLGEERIRRHPERPRDPFNSLPGAPSSECMSGESAGGSPVQPGTQGDGAQGGCRRSRHSQCRLSGKSAPLLQPTQFIQEADMRTAGVIAELAESG
jgi:hypothetical protein